MTAAFALALLELEGVGRVTSHRLLERFTTYDALRAYPREQVLLRLKGAPHADRTVALLFDEKAFGTHLKNAEAHVATCEQRHVSVLAPGDPHWPTGVQALDRSARPVVLYAFGSTELLTARPQPVALFGRAPVDPAAYESAHVLAQRLISEGLSIACGAAPGFDVPLHKLCAAASHPCVIVARAGLGKIDKPARPSVGAAVKAGGVLVSPFSPDHGPFEHDDVERARLQAALAGPSAFFVAESSPETRALHWALEADRPVFCVAGIDEALVPERVHRLARPVDFDWVVAAAREVA